jgi:hypothetical protein
MAKSVSKSEAIKAINSVDALEVLLESIDRNENTSSKRTKINQFNNEVQKQIKDERNVILIALKVK